MEADWWSEPLSGDGGWPPPPAAPPEWPPPPPAATPGRSPAYRPRRKGLLRRLGRAVLYLIILLLCLDLATEGYFVSLNWMNPPVSAYMVESGRKNLHDYVSIKYVSWYLIAATVAHEDAQLSTRFTGLDWDQWWSRARRTSAATRTPTVPRSRSS